VYQDTIAAISTPLGEGKIGIVRLSGRDALAIAEKLFPRRLSNLSGRIDLAQAESVLDVVRAKTAASLRVAVQGLGGRLSESLKGVRSELMCLLACLTARMLP